MRKSLIITVVIALLCLCGCEAVVTVPESPEPTKASEMLLTTTAAEESTDMDEEHFKNFMNSVHLRQLYDTGVDAEYGDHLITLSTCEYTYTNGRFVVVAKKV